MFKFFDYIQNKRKCKEEDKLRNITNGGYVDYDEEADLLLLPTTVYFNERSIAIVLLFKKISELPGVKINTNASVEKAFFVHTEDVNIINFFECKDGLYFYDPTLENIQNKNDVNAYNNSSLACDKNIILFSTVEENEKFFTKKIK